MYLTEHRAMTVQDYERDRDLQARLRASIAYHKSHGGDPANELPRVAGLQMRDDGRVNVIWYV